MFNECIQHLVRLLLISDILCTLISISSSDLAESSFFLVVKVHTEFDRNIRGCVHSVCKGVHLLDI